MALRKKIGEFRRKYIPIVKRDFCNRLLYGFDAPKAHELIWVNPFNIKKVLVPSEVERITGLTRSFTSGMVINWDEVERVSPLKDEFKIRYCIRHWQDGISWEDLGVVNFLREHSRKHRKKTEAELKMRFEQLDKAFEEVRREGRLKTRKEINPHNFREEDGILVHIGKDGELFFGSCGNHRLAMALVLGFTKIPAWLGLVDRHAISELGKYRTAPQSTQNHKVRKCGKPGI